MRPLDSLGERSQTDVPTRQIASVGGLIEWRFPTGGNLDLVKKYIMIQRIRRHWDEWGVVYIAVSGLITGSLICTIITYLSR